WRDHEDHATALRSLIYVHCNELVRLFSRLGMSRSGRNPCQLCAWNSDASHSPTGRFLEGHPSLFGVSPIVEEAAARRGPSPRPRRSALLAALRVGSIHSFPHSGSGLKV